MPSTKSTTQPEWDADTTIDDLKALIREAELALGEAGDQASDKIRDLRGRFREALDDGRGRLQELAVQARRQVQRADKLVHENPYSAIGIASALCLLAGYLIARGCNHNHSNR